MEVGDETINEVCLDSTNSRNGLDFMRIVSNYVMSHRCRMPGVFWVWGVSLCSLCLPCTVLGGLREPRSIQSINIQKSGVKCLLSSVLSVCFTKAGNENVGRTQEIAVTEVTLVSLLCV